MAPELDAWNRRLLGGFATLVQKVVFVVVGLPVLRSPILSEEKNSGRSAEYTGPCLRFVV
jgi:hypothetical protein